MAAAVSELARGFGAAAIIFFSLCIALVAVKILLGNRNEYDRNRSRAKGPWQVFTGGISPRRDGTRDDKVAAGIAIQKSTNQWVEQGRYSDEALRDVLSR